MSEVLDEIQTRVGEENLSTLRSRSGCGVNMTEAPSPRIVIDADRAFPAHGMTGKRCDYIIFFCDTANNCSSWFQLNLKAAMSRHQRSLNSCKKARTLPNVLHRRLPKPYASHAYFTKEFTRKNFSSFKGLVCVSAEKPNRLKQRAAIVH